MIEIIQTEAFVKWLEKLRDGRAMEIILARIVRMANSNFGDVKPVGEGVIEARIHYGAGYRLYYSQQGNVTIIMLGGGDKSTQEKDIKQAKALVQKWRIP